MPRKGWRKNRTADMAGESVQAASMRLAGNGHAIGLEQVLAYFRGKSVEATNEIIAAIWAMRNLVPKQGRPATKHAPPQVEA